jgi:prepilin-type N-terminal cleavage/methylation domain-containing protein
MCDVSRRQNSFTLIELLVVVAIIGIIAGMFLPVLGAAREKARRTYCLNNLQQLGKGLFAYSDDNRGWIPPMGGWYNPEHNNMIYHIDIPRGIGLLYPSYVNFLRIFFCPSAHPVISEAGTHWGIANWGNAIVLGSYTYRETYAGAERSMGLNAERVMICDYSNLRSAILNHNGEGLNVLRGDGSARWIQGRFDTRQTNDLEQLDRY